MKTRAWLLFFLGFSLSSTGSWSTIVSNIVGEANGTTYTNIIMDPGLLRKVFRVGRE